MKVSHQCLPWFSLETLQLNSSFSKSNPYNQWIVSLVNILAKKNRQYTKELVRYGNANWCTALTIKQGCWDIRSWLVHVIRIHFLNLDVISLELSAKRLVILCKTWAVLMMAYSSIRGWMGRKFYSTSVASPKMAVRS